MDTPDNIPCPFTSDWPIHPTFLSKARLNGEYYSPNRDGIYDSDTLRGFLADSSDDAGINNPLSLFQVVPTSCEFPNSRHIKAIDIPQDPFLREILGSERRVIRIDPENLYMNMPCCNLFRKCNNGRNTQKCFEQDNRIIILFDKELSKIHFKKNFEQFCGKLKEIIANYNESLTGNDKKSFLSLYSDTDTHELYVWYKCQYSNLLEYFFPIIHSGTIIAVLMQGQRIPEGVNQDELFPLYRNGGKYEAKLDRSIKNIPNRLFRCQPMSAERLAAIWERVRLIEERIDKEVLSFARYYVSNKFLNLEDDFHKQIETNIGTRENLDIVQFKSILNDILYKICDLFNKGGFINIYSTEPSINGMDTENITFYQIGTSLLAGSEQITDTFVFRNLPEPLLETIQNNGLAKFLIRSQQFSDNEIFRIENLLIGKMKNLIWKRYSTWKEYYTEQFEIFSTFLKSAYHTLLEPYNMFRSADLRNKLETSMRVSVHETSQIIPTIISILETEYNIDTRQLIREDKLSLQQIRQRERTIFDAIQRLTLLDGLYKRSTLIFKEQKSEESWNDFHRIVYALQTLFQKTAFDNNRQYINIVKNPFAFNKCDLFTDYSFLNHALFNLVDNAIKYGYRGTNINITISLPPEQLDYQKTGDYEKIDKIYISVISYGGEISEEDRDQIFKLFYRSSDSSKKEGMGIGLFLVKKLCNSLGYDVECRKSKLIANYNLPVSYYGTYAGEIDSIPFDKVDDETMRKVVNVSSPNIDWKIGKGESLLLLKERVYQNEFVITLKKDNSTKILLKHRKNEENINY